jgi:ADP-ribosylation factor-like protein 2
MQDCKDELWGLIGEERLAGATVLVFANKQDIHGAMNGEEIQKRLQLDKITLQSWRIQPCSAVTGSNLLAGLDWAVKDVGKRIYFHGASHAE